MPNRILREGILDSEAVNSLSESAENLYRRLMSVVDDHGRFDGRIEVLRARLFALKLADWSIARVETVLEECATTKLSSGEPLVERYVVDGKPYVQLNNFGQRVRSRSKFPDPPPRGQMRADDSHPRTNADIREQVRADVRNPPSSADNCAQELQVTENKDADNCGHLRADDSKCPPTRAQGRSESEAEAYSEAEAACGGDARATAVRRPPPASKPAALDPVLDAIAAAAGRRPSPEDLPPDLALLVAEHGPEPVVEWIRLRARQGVRSPGLFLQPSVISEIRAHVERRKRSRSAPARRAEESPDHYPPEDLEAALEMPGGAEAFRGYCRRCGWVEAKCKCEAKSA